MNIKEEPAYDVLDQDPKCDQHISQNNVSQNFNLYVKTGIEIKDEPLEAFEQVPMCDEQVRLTKYEENQIVENGQDKRDLSSNLKKIENKGPSQISGKRMKNKYLSQNELEEFVENFIGLESEDEYTSDIDDLEDPPFQLDEEEDVDDPDDLSFQPDVLERNLLCSSIPSFTSSTTKTNNKNIVWKKKHLELNQENLAFHGATDMPAEFLQLETPYQFFNYFFTKELLDIIVYQTNLYSVQQTPEKPPKFTEMDIRQYIGIIIYMSIVHMPNTKSYWYDELDFSKIKNTMSVNRFEKVRQYIHFNDNSAFIPRNEPEFDSLHKIRPLIDYLNSKFHSIPLEQYLCVDEQMCSTKVRHYMNQYMPIKPHKWDFKLFILAGVSGFAYNFEIYSGKQKFGALSEGEPDLGVTSNVVLRLSRIIPRHQNYRLYHDNYYTSLPLMVHLAKQGIHSLGTIRKNRLPNSKLPTEAALKKEKRGISCEYVTTLDRVDISSLIWKDNKCVSLISSFAGTNPMGQVKRFDRKHKQNIVIDCPFVIQEYNRPMGGVDLLDSLIGRYKIKVKSKKWYIRLFYHMIDLVMVNSWLAYKRVLKEKKKDKEMLNQEKFRAEVANCLCTIGTVSSKRGRAFSIENEIQMKKKKGPTQYTPPQDIRKDQIGHWPIMHVNKMRCKYPNCKGFTRTKCEKCGVGLCLNNNNNCFKEFHIN